MAGKLISSEEAAAMLGVTTARLGELRQRGDVHGVRDGAGWKYKTEDLERYQRENDAPMASESSGSLSDLIDFDAPASKSGLELPLDLGEAKPSSRLSDLNLDVTSGGSGLSGISGILSEGNKPAKKTPEPASSDIELKLGDSGLNLMSGSDLGLGSALNLGSGGGKTPTSSPSDVKLAGGSSIDIGGSSNVLGTGGPSSGAGDGGKTMLTSELADKPSPSSVKMTVRDQESVFGDAGSDLTHNIQGSGINLLDAGDSGLALDKLSLAASTSKLGKKKSGGSDLELKGEDDFLLTPLEEQTDDSTDSGSQVIALEGDFGDDATATLMAGDVPGLGAALEDAGGGLSPLGGPMAGGMGMGMAPVFAAPPEPSYGIGTVLTLGFSSIVMAVVGVMMYDILRNMWSWDTTYAFNSPLMDMILSLVGG